MKRQPRPCSTPPASNHNQTTLPHHGALCARPGQRRAILAAALVLAIGQARALPADGTGVADAVQASSEDPGQNATTLDAVQVRAKKASQAVEIKRNSAVMVDSVGKETIQVPSQEDSIAQKLVAAPGVSVMRDEDQPRYVTVRGIAANLNSTTLDGITMASVGDSGGGERKINLQLIPTDLADRIDIYKTFSAEQSPDGIGAAINLVSASAFDQPKNSLHIDTSVNYHDLSNSTSQSMEHTKSPWGNGFNGKYSTTFGSDDEFGVTLSARRQELQASQNKLFQSTQYFFDNDGNNISGPTSSGWNGMSAPYNFAYYADDRWIKSYGGAAKFEWRPKDSPLRASLMAYDYSLLEQRTENGYQILNEKTVTNQTPTSGTTTISSLNVIYQNAIWARQNQGVLGGLEWAQDEQSLALRAGYTKDSIKLTTQNINLKATPSGNQQLNYASSGVGEIYNITSLSDPSIISSSTYELSSASQAVTDAVSDVMDIRLDYSNNIGADARGLGVAAGLEYKQLGVSTDYTTTTYEAGGDYSSYLYYPSQNYPKSVYSLPYFNYSQFLADGGWSNLTVNQASSDYSSAASDFEYDEKVKDAYVSMHYATDLIEAVLGVRYDDTSYTSRTAEISDGAVTGTTVNKGSYHHALPSFNLVAHVADDTNLRFSASKTIGRPIPSNIAQAESTSCDSDTGECTVSRGNPNLKPQQSTNLDLSIEKFFNDNNGYVSLGIFRKDITDNIASISTEETNADGTITTVTTPQNLEDSKLRGVELAIVNRNIELWGQRFDVMFNATQMDGQMVYRWTGGSRTIYQLNSQPKKIANLGFTWHLPWLDSSLTISENYTGKHIFTIGSSSWTDRGFRSRYVTDIAWTSRIDDRWSMSLSAANLFGSDQYQTLGDDYQYMRNLNNYAATYALHVVYDFK